MNHRTDMAVDPLPAVAAGLRLLRLDKGLTQDALASAASMDPSEIRRIEAGRRDPGVRVLSRLAAGLQVRPSELLAGPRAHGVPLAGGDIGPKR